jgi:hypothetical protein
MDNNALGWIGSETEVAHTTSLNTRKYHSWRTTMAKKKQADDRLSRLSKYEGLLARWGEATGNVPDTLMDNKALWYMDRFREAVDKAIRHKKNRKKKEAKNGS